MLDYMDNMSSAGDSVCIAHTAIPRKQFYNEALGSPNVHIQKKAAGIYLSVRTEDPNKRQLIHIAEEKKTAGEFLRSPAVLMY